MTSFEINKLCDVNGCTSIETSELQDSPDETDLNTVCEDDGWVIDADDGNDYCPNHSHLAEEQ